MKKIAIFCVIYNSYKEFYDYIKSIEEAAKVIEGIDVDVFVADNTTINIQDVATTSNILNINVKQNRNNLGYFGGIQSLMKDIDCTCYDYVIISNVDVMMERNTLVHLCKKNITSNVGWIAPQIYSLKEERDRNPQRLHRYTRRRLKLLLFFFFHPLLDALYKKTLYKRKRSIPKSTLIYSGHGSFIILTKAFFKAVKRINYPIFLYCEELYLAEMCRLNSLTVEYHPDIRIIDIDHVSTGKMGSKLYYSYNAEAIKYILSTFY